MSATEKAKIKGMLECVEETNPPAFLELQEKARRPEYKFSDPVVSNTLKVFELLDENENINPTVIEIMKV